MQDIVPTPVALRGEHFALHAVEYRAGSDMEAAVALLQLVETTPDGRLVAIDLFEPDQLRDAVAVLDERYAARLERGCKPVWGAVRRAAPRDVRVETSRSWRTASAQAPGGWTIAR